MNDSDFSPVSVPSADSAYGVGAVGASEYGGKPIVFGILDVRVNRSLTIISAL